MTITVDENPVAPIQVRLATVPESQVRTGECVELSWEVKGTVDQRADSAGHSVIWEGAPQVGNLRDCPSGTGEVLYAVTAIGPGKPCKRSAS